jgi:hypothetical protein
MITPTDISILSQVSKKIGFEIDHKELIIEHLKKGKDHAPKKLKTGYFAVYMFKYRREYLKVGKVSGTMNNDRFYQHHYIEKAANSNLAKSILSDTELSLKLNNRDIREWICNETHRFNILIPKKYGASFVHFVEAFFILRCNPRYEGRKNKI